MPAKKKYSDDTRTLAIITHVLGLLTHFLGPLIVLLASENKEVKKHAKNVLNWQISLIIYYFASFLVSFILLFALIGFLTLPLLIITLVMLNIVFSIMGAVSASNDELWKYPLAIQFLKVK